MDELQQMMELHLEAFNGAKLVSLLVEERDTYMGCVCVCVCDGGTQWVGAGETFSVTSFLLLSLGKTRE